MHTENFWVVQNYVAKGSAIVDLYDRPERKEEAELCGVMFTLEI